MTGELNNYKLMRYVFLLALTVLYGCGTLTGYPDAEPYTDSIDESTYRYTVAPGDRLDIFVWRNPDISMRSVPVRPDGRISSPLVEDILASGKTPVQLARDIEEVLSQFIKEPFVTVTVTQFVGSFEQQVRIIGEATAPVAIPFRRGMTILDVMIAVRGLTEFAAGNKSIVVRTVDGEQRQINVRLEDLIKEGDISANIKLFPGDIIIIPESFF